MQRQATGTLVSHCAGVCDLGWFAREVHATVCVHFSLIFKGKGKTYYQCMSLKCGLHMCNDTEYT